LFTRTDKAVLKETQVVQLGRLVELAAEDVPDDVALFKHLEPFVDDGEWHGHLDRVVAATVGSD